MSELERLEKEGSPERRKNIEKARVAWVRLRRVQTDEEAILVMLSIVENVQHQERKKR